MNQDNQSSLSNIFKEFQNLQLLKRTQQDLSLKELRDISKKQRHLIRYYLLTLKQCQRDHSKDEEKYQQMLSFAQVKYKEICSQGIPSIQDLPLKLELMRQINKKNEEIIQMNFSQKVIPALSKQYILYHFIQEIERLLEQRIRMNQQQRHFQNSSSKLRERNRIIPMQNQQPINQSVMEEQTVQNQQQNEIANCCQTMQNPNQIFVDSIQQNHIVNFDGLELRPTVEDLQSLFAMGKILNQNIQQILLIEDMEKLNFGQQFEGFKFI